MTKPWVIAIMFNFLPIALLSTAVLRKVAYYAQYYAHNYCNYVTAHDIIQLYYCSYCMISYIIIVRLQPVIYFEI